MGVRMWRGLGLCGWVVAATNAPWAWARAPMVDEARPTAQPGDAVISAPLGPDGGVIDWTHRQILVSGHGAPPVHAFVPDKSLPYAQRRAEGMAQERLGRLVRALPLPAPQNASGQNVQVMADHLRDHPQLELLLHESLAHMQAISSVYRADGEVVLEMALSLDGGEGTLGALWATLWRTLGGTPPAPQAKQTKADAIPNGRQPTGIVIVARGTGFVPSLWPKITDSRGGIVYGPERVHPDVQQLRGLMGITHSLEAALRDPRVAQYALVLPALQVAQGANSTLMLADSEIQKLADLAPLLDEARIMVVVDG